MLHSFQISPFQPPYLLPTTTASLRVLTHSPTYLFPGHHTDIPLHWGIKPSQHQGPLLLLMPDKDIFCYRCTWN